MARACRPARTARRPHRVVAHAGASYSATLALQTLMGDGGAAGGGAARATFDALLLGSPSIPFDPEIMQALETDAPALAAPADAPAEAPADAPLAVFIAYGALEREPPAAPDEPPLPRPANVHAGIPDAAHALAALLAARGAAVDGAHELPGEDHGTMKFPFVSRGLMWLARRARLLELGHAAPDDLALQHVGSL